MPNYDVINISITGSSPEYITISPVVGPNITLTQSLGVGQILVNQINGPPLASIFSGTFYISQSISGTYAVTSSYGQYAGNATTAISTSYAMGGSGSFTGSFGGAFTGAFSGTGAALTGILTASYANTASAAQSLTFTPTTASYALTASVALNVPITASYSATSSVSLRAYSASYGSGSFFAQVALSSSYAATASVALNVPPTASYAFVAITASYALGGTGSYTGAFNGVHTGTFAGAGAGITGVITASYANTASYIALAPSASLAFTASLANTASYALSFALPVSSSITASYALGGSGSFSGTFVGNVPTASFASTASYVFQSGVAPSSSYVSGAFVSATLGVFGTVTASVFYGIALTASNLYVSGSEFGQGGIATSGAISIALRESGTPVRALTIEGSQETGSSLTIDSAGNLSTIGRIYANTIDASSGTVNFVDGGVNVLNLTASNIFATNSVTASAFSGTFFGSASLVGLISTASFTTYAATSSFVSGGFVTGTFIANSRTYNQLYGGLGSSSFFSATLVGPNDTSSTYEYQLFTVDPFGRRCAQPAVLIITFNSTINTTSSVSLSWADVPGRGAFDLTRQGKILQLSISGTQWVDIGLISGAYNAPTFDETAATASFGVVTASQFIGGGAGVVGVITSSYAQMAGTASYVPASQLPIYTAFPFVASYGTTILINNIPNGLTEIDPSMRQAIDLTDGVSASISAHITGVLGGPLGSYIVVQTSPDEIHWTSVCSMSLVGLGTSQSAYFPLPQSSQTQTIARVATTGGDNTSSVEFGNISFGVIQAAKGIGTVQIYNTNFASSSISSSYAATASYASNANSSPTSSYALAAPFSGLVQGQTPSGTYAYTGSVNITGSLIVSGNIGQEITLLSGTLSYTASQTDGFIGWTAITNGNTQVSLPTASIPMTIKIADMSGQINYNSLYRIFVFSQAGDTINGLTFANQGNHSPGTLAVSSPYEVATCWTPGNGQWFLQQTLTTGYNAAGGIVIIAPTEFYGNVNLGNGFATSQISLGGPTTGSYGLWIGPGATNVPGIVVNGKTNHTGSLEIWTTGSSVNPPLAWVSASGDFILSHTGSYIQLIDAYTASGSKLSFVSGVLTVTSSGATTASYCSTASVVQFVTVVSGSQAAGNKQLTSSIVINPGWSSGFLLFDPATSSLSVNLPTHSIQQAFTIRHIGVSGALCIADTSNVTQSIIAPGFYQTFVDDGLKWWQF